MLAYRDLVLREKKIRFKCLTEWNRIDNELEYLLFDY